jgi:N-acetylglucosamine-6-phosphate deacetylase
MSIFLNCEGKIMIIKNANVWDDKSFSFARGDIHIRHGVIDAIGDLSEMIDDCVIDAEGKPVIPGFIDVHTHGGAGHDFVGVPAEDLHEMARFYASHGVTSVMPTLASAPLPEMEDAAKLMTAFVPAADEADFCGVHLEGRYLNPTKKGAHAPHLLAPLNASELDCEGFRSCRALHITAAYELDTDGSFAEAAKAIGATMGL